MDRRSRPSWAETSTSTRKSSVWSWPSLPIST